jgi:hypothetical protein
VAAGDQPLTQREHREGVAWVAEGAQQQAPATLRVSIHAREGFTFVSHG